MCLISVVYRVFPRIAYRQSALNNKLAPKPTTKPNPNPTLTLPLTLTLN